MSGTSLDGIDLTELFFEVDETDTWKFNMLNATTIEYSSIWKESLQKGFYYSNKEINSLNKQYTQFLADVISDFIQKNNINDLDAVCSHGHTIWHQPKKGITLQIGNLESLAKKLNQIVVCDFRVQDVNYGGQGAPLVPIGDRLLFPEYAYCINIGGFANISFEDERKKRIAYDVCPVNIVLNAFALLLDKPYDEEGAFAASGKLNEALLANLNELDYYTKPAPKSLGVEWIQKNITPLLDKTGLDPIVILNTFVEHIAIQLAAQIPDGVSVLITGGGAYNTYLINRLQAHVNTSITIPSSDIIEYKEALIFGLLGVLRLRNSINCLSSITGAKRDHSSGLVFIP